MRINLPRKEIQTILRDNQIPILQALSQLNGKQRNWVISQANGLGDTLVHVSRWTATPMETVFGNINITSLFWITESAYKGLSPSCFYSRIDSVMADQANRKFASAPEQEFVMGEVDHQFKTAIEKPNSEGQKKKKSEKVTCRFPPVTAACLIASLKQYLMKVMDMTFLMMRKTWLKGSCRNGLTCMMRLPILTELRMRE